MKLSLYIFCLLSFLPGWSNPPDTLYYDINWNLCESYKALFYRVATLEKQEIKFDGPVKDFTVGAHRLIMEGNYDMGKKNGLFTFYHFNGQTESSGIYENNRRSGQWSNFHPNGKPHKLITYTTDGKYLLQALWDSSGNQLVNDGNGTWVETNRNTDNNRFILITGKVEKGKREGKWQVSYTNGELLLEEHFINGDFNFGDKWVNGKKSPYYLSLLNVNEYAELSKPEDFIYDLSLMDKNYYGEGLYYFLQKYLGIDYNLSGDKEYMSISAINEASIKCNKEYYVPAAYPGGPLGLYRFLQRQKAKLNEPDHKSGMVVINMKINKYGKVKDYYLSKGISITQNNDAIEKVKKLVWLPASCNGTNINSYKRIVIFN